MQDSIKGYEVRERIGKGGFGEVYRAYQPLIERDVAVKVILPIYVNEPEFIRRFESEAQLVARLEHPFIVPLYDFWRDSQGAYLVMRWLPNNLRRVLDEGALSLDDTLRMSDQIASALAVAHRNNVIHRDIKPDNILLDHDDNAYLTDFGIAKVGAANPEESEGDDEGESAGSPAYMSPEQISVAMHATPASDIYSLGFVIYEMLTGKHPFKWEYLPQVLIMHLQEEIPDLPGDLARLDHVLKRATMKEPSERYQSVLEFAAALRGAALGEPVVALAFDESTLMNPYKGLRAFEEADSDDFFGRDALIQQMMSRLEDDDPLANFLAVVGPSGSGKSSVVHAGLIPRLRAEENLYMVDMVPGSTPIENLTAGLLSIAVDPPGDLAERLRTDVNALDWALEQILNDTNDDVLLVIDQFEEVFTLVEAEAERTHFLDLLRNAVLDPTPRIKVVITLRADFYDRPLLYEGFGEFVQKRTQVVLPLTTEELTRTIVGPAERVGMVVEPELIAAVIEDVREEPGALPLLQYALTEVFERRDGKTLTVQAYRESGGVVGALARRADEVYQSLSISDQRVVRQIMLRLVTLGEGTEDTRRRVRRAELLEIVKDKAALSRVLDAYGKYRLLTFDVEMNTREPMVEVAHEAIIREWGRLREWLNESRDDVRLQRLLSNAAQEWQKADEDSSYLLRGARLVQFDEWTQETDLALTDVERGYLESSLKEREHTEQAERERQERERLLEQRSRARLQALVALLAVAVVVAGILSAWALSQNQAAQRSESTAVVAQEIAETQASIAELNANQAQAVALAANARVALNNSDNELAIALALAANAIEPRVPEARRALADVIYQPGLRGGLGGHSGGTTQIDRYDDWMLTGGFDGEAILWDAEAFSEIRRFAPQETTIGAVAFSADGETLIIGTGRTLSRDEQREVNPIILYDRESGAEIARLEGHTDGVTALTVLDDRLLSASFNGEIIYWDMATGEIIWQIQEESQSIISNLSISPDGTRFLASASSRTDPTLYDLETGEAILTLDHAGVGTDDVLFLNDEQAFTAARDGVVRLWDLTENRLIRDYLGHDSRVRTLTLDLPNNQVFSAASNSMIIAWDIDTGEQMRGFFGRGPTIFDMIYLPETGQVVTTGGGSSFDDAVRLWDIESGAILHSTMLETGAVTTIAQVADDVLLAGTLAGDILRIDPATLDYDVLATYEETVFYSSAVMGERVLFGLEAGDVIIWDAANQTEAGRLTGHTDIVQEIFVMDDAVITGSFDNTIRRWDIDTGEELARFTLPFQTLDISPDGESLLAISQDGVGVIVDATTGERLNRFQINTSGNTVLAADWHDALVVVSLSDGSLIEIDSATGAEINRFGGGGLPVRILDFYVDGSLIITAPLDASLTFWDTVTGSDVERRAGHGVEITALHITPERILSASRDGALILWRVDPTLDDLITWVNDNRTVRDLTCAERAQYNVLPLCEVVIPTPTAQPIQRETVEPGEHRGEFPVGGGDVWLIEAQAGDIITIDVVADNSAAGVDDPERRVELGLLDTAMVLRDPDGRVVAENDDRAVGEDTNSRIEAVPLLLDGVYQVEVRSFANLTGGAYTIIITVEQGS